MAPEKNIFSKFGPHHILQRNYTTDTVRLYLNGL